MSCLEAKDIQVYLGDREVLKNAHLQLQQGKMVGLIGPNGAGKSTLVKAVAGLLPIQSGKVEVNDEKIEKIARVDLAKTLAYLPQGREVHWPLTVERVVALGRLPHLQPWQQMNEKDQQVIAKAMKDADVDHLANRPVDELAGGERALVMLARVLAIEPAIILADEPVAGLDPNHQIQVMQLLRDYAHQNRGVLVVLHDLSLAARYCDELYLMHEGNILDSGDPKQVLSDQNLKASYGIEVQFGKMDDGFYVVPTRRL